MTSQNSIVSSNCSMQQASLDEARQKHLLSLEEARRKHLLSLQHRPRLRRSKVTDDSADDSKNNNNSGAHRKDEGLGPSCPSNSSGINSLKRNNLAMYPPLLCNNSLHNRSFSTATYQPLYQPQLNVSLMYYPAGQNLLPPFSQRLRSTEIRPFLDVPVEEGNEVDNDDVFVANGNRSGVNGSQDMALPFPNGVPCSPSTMQLNQSRKRAHSAGDMIGLYSPTTARFLYPNSLPFGLPVNTFNNPNGTSLTSQTPFVSNASTYSLAPHKQFTMDGTASLSRDHFQHPPAMPVHVLNRNSISKSSNVQMSNPMNNSVAKTPRNLNLLKNSDLTSGSSSSLKTRFVKQQEGSAATKLRKIISLTSSTQPRSSGRTKPEGQPQPSSLKSSLSSKSHSVKKKVAWNDLPNGKRKIKGPEPLNRKLKSINVDTIKANPDKFTSANEIGPYLIGPKIGNCPVKSISQFLVRKRNTSNYYMAKILQMDDEEVKNGKMLLHTEYSLLSLLDSHFGVIRQHGLFKDLAFDKRAGKVTQRVGLILDCLTPHEYNTESLNYLNLQQHVIQMKRLNEQEAIRIFYSILLIVHSLHECNVVHRDLKLGNMVLDKRTRRIILTNFCLGCHLTSDRDVLTDQRGSPAYISPDVLSDKPYAGKPSDMWSLGVILYTMLYGQFPFYDQEPKELFAKIKKAEYTIPKSGQVSNNTNELIQGLLTLDPTMRLTAGKALISLETSSSPWMRSSSLLQVVPDLDDPKTCDGVKITFDHVISEDELTRAFKLKMLSDDEDDDASSNYLKNVRSSKIFMLVFKKRRGQTFNGMTSLI